MAPDGALNTERKRNMTETPTSTTEPDTEPSTPEFQPITLESQADVDKFIGAAKKQARANEAAKYPNYETFKTKAGQYDSMQAASMTQTEKDAARIRELENLIADRDQALATERHAGLRRDVASAKGVPADRITGETREELEASADELLEWQKATSPSKPRPPVAGLKSGASNTDARMDKKEQAAALLRQFYGAKH